MADIVELLNELCNSEGDEVVAAIDVSLQMMDLSHTTHDIYSSSQDAVLSLLQPPEGMTMILSVKYGKYAANIVSDHLAMRKVTYRGSSERLACALLAAHVAYKFGKEFNA